jgi:PKD repeat protein
MTSGGAVNFDIYPQDKFTKSANLDIQARLLDNGGTEILVSNISTAAMSANLNTTLAAGTYYIEVDGVGYLNPSTNGYSDYASVGQFSIDGVYPPGDNSLAPAPSISYNNICGTVNFEGIVLNGYDSLYWDFDDGSSSNALSPSHTYTSSNTYSVTLTAFNSIGSNSSSPESVIVEFIASPIVVSDTTCANDGDITLKATGGSGTLHWYDSQTFGTRLYTGANYSTNITQPTSYYVQETNAKATGNVGPSANTIGSGGYYSTNKLWGLFFDAHEDFILKSVKIYALTTGGRIIKISKGDDDSYTTLAQKILFNVPQGESRVDLDVLISKGTQYFIQASGSTIGLYRNTTGSSFPYTYNNVVSITRNNDFANPGYYYYFYDWEVEPVGCSSERTKVTAWVDACSGVDDIANNKRSSSAYFNSSSNLSVQLNNFRKEVVQVSILNSLGQIIHNTKINTTNESIMNNDINIPDLSTGIYYINFSNENTNQTIKLIKTN